MKFIRQYSSRILSFRQKGILYGCVTLCVCVTIGTYFVVEYFAHAMRTSIADKQAHIRVVLSENDSVRVDRIVCEIKKIKNVARCDWGYSYSGDFYLTSHRLPENFEDERGEVYFEGMRRIEFTAYKFDDSKYCPPVFLENVYSKANREQALEYPEDDPINIMSSPEAGLRNYGIVNKSLTSIFPLGPSTFANRFEIFGKDSRGELIEVPMLTAGYITDSPLSIGGEAFKIFTKPSVLEKIVPRETWDIVVDCSMSDCLSLSSVLKEVSQICTPRGILTWKDLNPQAEDFLSGVKTSSYLGVCAILMISVVGVGMLISMLIEEKSRQIAILHALGMNSMQLRSVFLWVGFKVACFACFMGTIGAWVIVQYFLPELTDVVRMFCQIQEESLVFSWKDGFLFWILVILFCLLISWIPTCRIAESDPVKYLRSE